MSTMAIRSGEQASSPRQRRHAAVRFGKWFVWYIVLTAVAAVFMVPYLLTLFNSLKPISQIFTEPAWYPPSSLQFSNYSHTLFQQDFIRYLGNTALVTVVLTVGQVFFSMLGAWAFGRMRFPGRDAIFWLYLMTLMVPNIVTIIPLYAIVHQMHLLDTYWALFLPYVFGTPYTIFLMRQFFRNIPQEVIDAARIDGCSELGLLRRIVLPLSKPVIITAALIAFVFSWNNFLWPLIATSSQSLYVLTTGMANFESSFGVQWNLLLAGAMIMLLPMLILFAIFQRHIIRSIQLSQVR
jgi:multiple sugar transport system permease protein